jgi:hypothetical protein
MKEKRKFRIFIYIIFLIFSSFLSLFTITADAYAAKISFSAFDLAQQTAPPAKSREAQAKAQPEKPPEKIIPAPRNIKESTAIYVFLGWMWLSIAVLIYIIRLKIKEADRLYAIKFFSPEKK